MYKALSEYAFRTGHDYWGWRFMGWGMHYVGDMSQPYHATLQPGVSTASSIWTNTKDVLGFPQAKTDAIQLLSNRHFVIEKFQAVITHEAYAEQDSNSVVLKALTKKTPTVEYTDRTFVDVFAKNAYDKSEKLADYLTRFIPAKLVSDPSFEVDSSEEIEQVVELITAQHGQDGLSEMTSLLGELMQDHSANTRSFVTSICRAKTN